MLCETIGARPTGSAKNKAAVDYAFGVLKNCGLQTRKQEFDCIDWINSGASLLIDGRNVTVESAEYSLPCDLEAAFIGTAYENFSDITFLPYIYQVRRKAPAFRHGDIRRIAPSGADCCARMRW